ncbi:hypothetical protein BVX98_05740 [bacterium F11]|nr:hypothetical protein BVX98_05740 [bacterium F11]
MIIKRIFFPSLTLILFLSHLSAALDEQLHFIGFSVNGRFLAFERNGINDVESPEQSSKTIVVDVEKNQWVSGSAMELIEEYEIKDNNTGFHVYSRLKTDFSSSNIKFSDGKGPLWNMYGPKIDFFELILDQGEGDCKSIDLKLRKSRGFSTLSVTSKKGNIDDLKTHGSPIEITLQKDSKVPTSRGCPFYYRVSDVYLFKKKYIAVFLQYFQSGYEGSNIRYMVVTGKIPD